MVHLWGTFRKSCSCGIDICVRVSLTGRTYGLNLRWIGSQIWCRQIYKCCRPFFSNRFSQICRGSRKRCISCSMYLGGRANFTQRGCRILFRQPFWSCRVDGKLTIKSINAGIKAMKMFLLPLLLLMKKFSHCIHKWLLKGYCVVTFGNFLCIGGWARGCSCLGFIEYVFNLI